MELPFAGLHQLCAPLLDRLDALPQPQRDALRVAFGLASGAAPDRFLVGLATLTLLADVAEEQPLLCLVDDLQWLDDASAQVLGFVARRLLAEPVAIVFAVREPSERAPLPGLPELRLEGLDHEDARALLATVVAGRLDERVRDRIIAETRGNPLALLELPRGMSAAELAGGFALPGPLTPHGHRGRASGSGGSTRCPPTRGGCCSSRRPTRSASRCWCGGRPSSSASIRTRRRRRSTPACSRSARRCGSATRACARRPTGRRRRTSATRCTPRWREPPTPQLDPDRRAWHRAQATPGPDEQVAEELERSAGRALARGGIAAAAAFLETRPRSRRTRRAARGRLLAAARAKRDAGALDAALELLRRGRGRPGRRAAGGGDRAAAGRDRVRSAPRRRGRAAARSARPGAWTPLDAELARTTHLKALGAAMWAGDRAACRRRPRPRARRRPAPEPPRAPWTSLLDALRDAA